MYKVSICIPTYEQPENLDKCLDSIVSQTFKDYEVIISDDSRTNSVELIVDKYKKVLNITYIKNQVPKGSPENWNEAIRHARGKYIKILHHDDRFRDSFGLERFIELIESCDDIDAVFCSSYHVNKEGKYVSSHILSDERLLPVKKDSKNLFFGNQLGAPSIMLYRNGLNIFFDKRMRWLVDIDFYIRLLQKKSFIYTKEELISINISEEYRVTNGCINDRNINVYETMIMFDKFDIGKLNVKYKMHFIFLFLRFKVSSLADIRELGYKNSVHLSIIKLLWIVRVISPFYKFFLNIKNTFNNWIYRCDNS
ncbi:glycosyltransferase family 2 protein [Francisella sp. SYW-2]|uniref:glycosyltransferase family 2 protein n=1 Tax=Francisella sp. SYW-2 TaxID=2610886 RepID=UPI00123CB961|nr:glycosyltransferase family 2 protein [Francisella sp. SYW-2]